MIEARRVTYQRLTGEQDKDIPYLHSLYKLPEISRFISIDEDNYWHYVTTSESVYYYKVYDEERLVASIHCELSGNILYMDIMAVPEYQKKGIGSTVLRDIQNGVLPIAFEQIEVSVDESNTASINLFEKMNFRYVSRDGELVNYVYMK